MLNRVAISSLAIVATGFIVYILFFHHYDPTANNIAAYETKQQADETSYHVAKALVYLKNKDYQNAENVILSDFEGFKNADAGVYRTERSIYDYAVFMLTPNDDPIQKYTHIQFAKPIDGVLTQEQLDQMNAEWKPKSEAASANIQKQIDEVFSGLSSEEKTFVELYTASSTSGKKPDPNVIATQATNGTVEQAKAKASKWMNDPRILEAISKYQAISTKYPAK